MHIKTMKHGQLPCKQKINEYITEIFVEPQKKGICFGTLLCIKNQYPFRNLIGANVMFGSFLMIPFTFSVMLLNLFELEERNHTLKNILVQLIAIIEIRFLFRSKMIRSSTGIVAQMLHRDVPR